MDFYEKNKKRIHQILFIAGLVLLIYVTVKYLFSYIAPFAIGYVISLLLEPLVSRITGRHKGGRGIAAFMSIIVLIFAVGVLGTSIVLKIINEGKSFVVFAIQYINEVPFITGEIQYRYYNILSYLPDDLQVAFGNALSGMVSGITSALGSLLRTGTGNVVSGLPNIFLNFILTFVSTFFFIKDRNMIRNFLKPKASGWISNNLFVLRKGLSIALGGYVKAQLILLVPTTIICLTGLAIMRYPYALFMGIAIGILDMLPIFGAGAVLWPWAIYSFATGSISNGIGLLVIYGLIFITRQTLEPRFLGKQIGIHPLITLMSIYIGLRIFGIFGFFIGPATAVIIKAFIESEVLRDLG